MKPFVFFLAVLLLPAYAVAPAQDVLIPTKGAAPGTYYFKMTVAADGAVTFERMNVKVVSIGDPGPDDPGGPDDPPDPLTGLAKTARDAALQVQDPNRAQTAKAIAEIYRQVRSLMNSGISNANQLNQATDVLFNGALGATGKLEMWKPWKTTVDKAIADGQLAFPAGYSAAWEAVAKGMEAVQ